MIKINFIFDKTKKSLFFIKKILKKYENFSPKKADCFVIAGGDGFMLSSIKKNFSYNKPFYGVNCGSYGFLMNKVPAKDLEKKIRYSKKIKINPLKIKAIDIKNKKYNLIAINEVSLFRQSKQTCSLQIFENKKMILKKLVGDGILVSSPAGSTAYNYSANGPVLSLKSGKLALTAISPFRPRQWRGKIVSNKCFIKIKNLNPKKRPLALVADNIEKRNIKILEVKNDITKKITLLYDGSTSLIKKIKKEQKRL